MKPEQRQLVQAMTLPAIAGWGVIFMGIAKDDQTFIGVGAAILAVTAIGVISYKLKTGNAQKALERRIWNEGTPATATIIDISTAGGALNDNPKVDFELEVTVEGRAPYTAKTSAYIKKLRVPSIQPGMTIDVRVDPENPDNVLIDEKLTYLGYG